MNIVGDRVLLRAIERKDLPLLRLWSNDASIQSMLGGWHFPVGEKDQDEWYESIKFNSLNQRFAIESFDSGLIGTANLVSIDWQNRTAFHGMLIGDAETRGKGYAADALSALMRFAFDEMNLYRLDSDIIEYNIPSLRFYLEKSGWKKDGVRKGWYFRAGRRWDKILIGMTHEHYKQHCASPVVPLVLK